MILNIHSMPNKFKCRNKLGRYLYLHGVPLLGRDKDFYYFARTEILDNALKKAPWYLKIL